MSLEILSQMNILYAEDDKALRDSLKKTLKLIFKNVYVAKDGAEAISLFDTHHIHIALLDYVMPEIDGFGVTQHIRETHRHTPVIIGSAYSDKEKLLNAIDSGVVSYLEKPFTEQTLFESFFKGIKKLSTYNLLQATFFNGGIYDFLSKKYIKDGTSISLSKQEIILFELLLEKRGTLVQKEMIEKKVFNGYVSANSLRTVIYRLRKKVGDETILTIQDLGYKII